jgi:hypothetical protein
VRVLFKLIKRSLFAIIVIAILYFLGIVSWNFYLERRLENNAKRLKVGMSDIEVMHIMGKARYVGESEPTKLEAGDWSNPFVHHIDCMSYFDIQKINNLIYFVYHNYLINMKNLKKKTGNIYIIVYFDMNYRKVVCVKKRFVL